MEIAFIIVAFLLLFFVAKEKESAKKFTKDRIKKIYLIVESTKKEVEMLHKENLSRIKPADIFTQVVEKKYNLQQQLASVDKEISEHKEQTLEREMLELHREALETALEVQNNVMLYVKDCILQKMNTTR